MGEQLTHDDGDECPVTTDVDGETEECDHTLKVRRHERDPHFEETEPAAPVIELICPIHGVVESA